MGVPRSEPSIIRRPRNRPNSIAAPAKRESKFPESSRLAGSRFEPAFPLSQPTQLCCVVECIDLVLPASSTGAAFEHG